MASPANSTFTPSRRSFFGSAIAAGACGGLVLAPSADAALIATCARARALIDYINDPKLADRSDAVDDADLIRYEAMLIEVVSATPQTPEGRAAKAQLAQYEFQASTSGKDINTAHVSDKLIWSVLTA